MEEVLITVSHLRRLFYKVCAMLKLLWGYIRKKRKGGIVYSSWYKLRLYAQCAQECLDCFHIVQKKKEHVERGEGRKKGWWT